MLSFKGVKEMRSEEWFYQIPFFALVSICSGALGALFNALHKLLRRVRAAAPFFPVFSHLLLCLSPWRRVRAAAPFFSPLSSPVLLCLPPWRRVYADIALSCNVLVEGCKRTQALPHPRQGMLGCFQLWAQLAGSAYTQASEGHCALPQYRAPRSNNALRLLESAGLAALTVVMMLGLSYFAGTCVDVPDWHEKDYGFTFHCTDGALAVPRLSVNLLIPPAWAGLDT